MHHEMVIPDELLDWATDPSVEKHFRRPWASEAKRLAAQGASEPLDGRLTERLLARLDGVVSEALRAGQGHLLLGFDMLTAELLKLRFHFGDESVGPGGDWTYAEVREVLASDVPEDAMRAARAARAYVSEGFPGARIDAIILAQDVDGPRCTGCGAEAGAMVTLESGNEYCRGCWRGMVSPPPVLTKRGQRGKR